MNYPVTPDGRYFIVRERLWRASNPALEPARREARSGGRSHPRLWPKLNRIGQFVSAGGDLEKKHGRPTLVKCRTRACGWSMWVALVPDSEALLAFCPGCHKEEMLIHNWQDTLWALERLDSHPVLE